MFVLLQFMFSVSVFLRLQFSMSSVFLENSVGKEVNAMIRDVLQVL